MDPNALMNDIALPATLMLVATLIGVIVGVVLGVQAITRAVPWAPLAALVTGPIVWIAVLSGLLGADGGEHPDRALHLGTAPMMLTPFLMAAPTLLSGLFLAFAGASRGPRAWWAAALVGVPALVVVILPIVGGYTVGQGLEEIGVARSILYGIAAIPLLVAALAGDPEQGSGPAASASMGVLFTGLVGAGEAAGRSLFWFLLIGPFVATRPEHRMEVVDRVGSGLLDAAAPYAHATVAAAVLAGLIALIPALRVPGRGRWLAAVAGGAVMLGALPWFLAGPSRDTWEAAAAMPWVEVPTSPLPGSPGPDGMPLPR